MTAEPTMLLRRHAASRRRLATVQAEDLDAVVGHLLTRTEQHLVINVGGPVPSGRPIAVGYLRISQDTEGDAHGVMNQWAELRQRFERDGLHCRAVYVDNDTSAYDTKKVRHAFKTMVDDGWSGHFSIIVAWALDRLTRNTRDLVAISTLGQERAVRFIGVTSGAVNFALPSDEFTFGVLAGVARLESAQKAERLNMNIKARAGRGEWIGGLPPFGFDLVTDDKGRKTLVANDVEAAIIRRMVDDITLDHRSVASIARALTAEGVPTPSGTGKRWTPAGVLRAVRHPAIAGLRFNTATDEHEPAIWSGIVDRSTWLTVGRVTKATYADRRQPARSYLLTGLIYGPGGDRGTATVIYPARTRAYRCKGAQIPAESLEEWVSVAVVKELVERSEPTDVAEPVAIPSADEAKLLELKARREKAATKWAAGTLSDEAFELLDGEVTALEREVTARQVAEGRKDRRDGFTPSRSALDLVRELRHAKDPMKVWNELPLSMRRDAIELAVERVVVRGRWVPADERVTITWREW